jgi:hypothetical protein
MTGLSAFRLKMPRNNTSLSFALRDVSDFNLPASRGLKDVHLDSVDRENL